MSDDWETADVTLEVVAKEEEVLVKPVVVKEFLAKPVVKEVKMSKDDVLMQEMAEFYIKCATFRHHKLVERGTHSGLPNAVSHLIPLCNMNVRLGAIWQFTRHCRSDGAGMDCSWNTTEGTNFGFTEKRIEKFIQFLKNIAHNPQRLHRFETMLK